MKKMNFFKSFKEGFWGYLILILSGLFYFFHFREHPDDLPREIRKIIFFISAFILIFLIQTIRITSWMFRNRHLLTGGILSSLVMILFTTMIIKLEMEPGAAWIVFAVFLGFAAFFIFLAFKNIREEKKLIRSTPYTEDETGGLTCPASLFSLDEERMLEGRILLLPSKLILLLKNGPIREYPLSAVISAKIKIKWLVVRRIHLQMIDGEQFTLLVPFPNFWKHKLTAGMKVASKDNLT